MTRSPFRSVMIALACVGFATTLAGCGRKGGLDLPPQAQARAVPTAALIDETPPDLGPGSVVDQSLREADQPAPQRSRRKFVLDPLLD